MMPEFQHGAYMLLLVLVFVPLVAAYRRYRMARPIRLPEYRSRVETMRDAFTSATRDAVCSPSLSVSALAALLRDAERAHAEHEKTPGPHVEWPEWYANYIRGRITASENATRPNPADLDSPGETYEVVTHVQVAPGVEQELLASEIVSHLESVGYVRRVASIDIADV